MDWNQWTPRERATLCFIVKDGSVLLIRKKRGLGAGKINGPGGKIEPGESALACAVRETLEEVGVRPLEVREHGVLHFQFTDGYSLHCTVFRAGDFAGTPIETDEAVPLWFPVAEIPWEEMWADDRHWLPQALAGGRFQAWFVFEGDTMRSGEVRMLDERSCAGYAGPMNTLPLGPGGLRTSRLAYGCWRIAPSGDPASDLATARRAVHAALEAGYTLFDHADIYCEGRAESVFGEILRESPEIRDRIVLASKCGIRFADQPAGAPYRYDFSAAHLVAQCEQSLRRLGVECVDLYQLHRPDWLMEAEEVAGALEKLRAAGKVREFGVSNFSPAQVTLLQQACSRPLAVNQVEISLTQLASLADGTLDQCQALKITPLAWSPLGGGLLGDGGKDLLPAQQHYQPQRILPVLDEIATARGSTRTAIALAWLLRHPAGIVPLVGSTDPARIRSAVAATSCPLTREEWYRLFTAARGEPLP